MSLFKSREFWCTDCVGDNEDFEVGSLKISKLNGDYDYVLVGGHSGVLRVYRPSTVVGDGGALHYKASDLQVEKNLGSPVLQVDVGKLVSASPFLQIAILHPRSFAIYSFTTKEGVTEQGNQNMINLLYEHKLRRSAANFVVGPFGGTQNRDFIAVQSLDGMLSFFEQETFVFCCFLPNFLLPGPFAYSKRTDSFVIAASNLNVESYSYKTLSSIGQNTDENDVSGLKFGADWSFNLSESILDMQYVYDGFSRESFVMILGERNMYCLTDNGKLRFMKRFDYSPCCFTTYLMGENKLMSLVISETSTLLVYQNTTLRWSAQLPVLPCSVARGSFERIKGILVCLSETGRLQCSYMGTQPSLFSAPPLSNQELDFEKAENELSTLNKIIKATYTNDLKLTNKTAERELAITITVDPHLQPNVHATSPVDPQLSKMCEVSVQIEPHAIFEEISLIVNVQRPLEASPRLEFYQNLSAKTTFRCHVYLKEEGEVPSLDLEVVASCISNVGLPRVVRKVATLPLNLVARTGQVLKETLLKVTLSVNKNSVPLATLFPEFIGENSLTLNSNAVCFSNVSGVGAPVTILLAKSSQRYRLQSDSAAAMNLLVLEMVRRLQNFHAGDTSLRITFNSTLPITQIVQYLNEHFECRRKVTFLQNELIQLGSQFRVIQKRLIAKFKDRNPTPLTNLDMLLNDTYKRTVEACKNLEDANGDLRRSQMNLTCALKLSVTLVKLMEDVKDTNLVENALSPYVYDIEGQSYEDTLDVSLSYLLRTALAKSEKDRLRAPHTNYEEVKELTKLEKHLSLVLERSAKKGVIMETQGNLENEDSTNQNVGNVEGAELLPAGSRIGEASSRALSAKHTVLRRRQRAEDDQ